MQGPFAKIIRVVRVFETFSTYEVTVLEPISSFPLYVQSSIRPSFLAYADIVNRFIRPIYLNFVFND